MTRILLLGAGFSNNWGGWLGSEVFEYLLGCPEVIWDPDLQARLWRHKDTGGFEATLEELQSEAARSGDRTRLEKLEAAIYRMFSDMDAGFRNGNGEIFRFEFAPTTSLVKEFLTGFDAIFTLNQDVLLERHYFTTGLTLIRNRRTWDGWIRCAGYEASAKWRSTDFGRRRCASVWSFRRLYGGAQITTLLQAAWFVELA